ncbi:MAG: acyltransferase family protein [Hyphomonadaceae bacterium]
MNTHTAPKGTASRVEWVDYSKGICILLVVLFHTVNHYTEATGSAGWMQAVIDFSKPFRMPDFFLISGLFLARTINAPLRDYIDRKVVHFAYFYLLWLAITFAITDYDVLLSDPARWVGMIGWNILQPVGTLWFVHMLAVFYLTTRIVRRAPKWAVFLIAAALQIAHQGGWIDTPSYALNRAMDYYVFFFLGYWAHGAVFAFVERSQAFRLATIGGLALWAALEWILTSNNIAALPGVGLILGVAGALAVASVGGQLAQLELGRFLRYCGRNSIVIYLTFFFPMMVLVRALAKTQIVPDAGWACFLILVASAASPLAFHALIRNTPLNLLYVRPGWARLGAPRERLTPATA